MAMDNLKSASVDNENTPLRRLTRIDCLSPKQKLGMLSLQRFPVKERDKQFAELAPFKGLCSHVALMRKPELVVKYIDGPPLSSSQIEYAGVFITDEQVDNTFARSEPPTHDDWAFQSLDSTREKTFVRVALRRIDEAVKEFIAPPSTDIQAEASYQGTWAFMACVLWPDIVRWRFPGVTDMTSKDRFLGGSRGLRNTFGRVWWRAYLLQQPGNDHPYELLELLGEDELVQVTERPNIAGSPVLAKQICKTFLETVHTSSTTGITRSKLLRDAMKRFRRLLPLVSFDALDENVLQVLVSDIFKASLASLSSERVAS